MTNNERIGFHQRIKALLTDLFISFKIGLIVGIPTGLIGLILYTIIDNAFGKSPVKDIAFWLITFVVGAVFIIAIIGLLINILWFFYLDIKKGATPGKTKLGLQIKNADGSPASKETLLTRALFKYGGFIILIVTLLSGAIAFGIIYILVIFFGYFLTLDHKKQSLHDRITNTAVFKK